MLLATVPTPPSHLANHFEILINSFLNDLCVKHLFVGKVYRKQIIGVSNFQETYIVFCPERPREIWVSDHGQFSVIFAHFRAATVQQICIQAVVRASI